MSLLTGVAHAYLSTHTVYGYKILFFSHYFGGIWPYWKADTGKHNFHEILLLLNWAKRLKNCWMSSRHTPSPNAHWLAQCNRLRNFIRSEVWSRTYMCISHNLASSYHCHMYWLEFRMPLPPAKKQKTLACIREIQVHKHWTKVYSQKGLTAMHLLPLWSQSWKWPAPITHRKQRNVTLTRPYSVILILSFNLSNVIHYITILVVQHEYCHVSIDLFIITHLNDTRSMHCCKFQTLSRILLQPIKYI